MSGRVGPSRESRRVDRRRGRAARGAPFGLLVALTLGGCGGRTGPARVAVVDGLVVEAIVVEDLARREGLDFAEARRRALDVARLVAAARAAGGVADPGELLGARRRGQLERAALARRWLEDVFEAEHGPARVPDELWRPWLADPSLGHRGLVVICQFIARPAAELAPEAAQDPSWRAEAQAALEVLRRRTLPYLQRPDGMIACADLGELVARIAPPVEPTRLGWHSEAGLYEVCRRDVFEPGFVDAFCGRAELGWAPIFFTSHGAHLAFVAGIEPPHGADEPEARERAARIAALPEARARALPKAIAGLRSDHVVRLRDPAER